MKQHVYVSFCVLTLKTGSGLGAAWEQGYVHVVIHNSVHMLHAYIQCSYNTSSIANRFRLGSHWLTGKKGSRGHTEVYQHILHLCYCCYKWVTVNETTTTLLCLLWLPGVAVQCHIPVLLPTSTEHPLTLYKLSYIQAKIAP